MKDWPKDNKPTNFDALSDSVVRVIEELYTLTPKEYGDRIEWEGLASPPSPCNLSFEESLTRENLEYSEQEQGRSTITTCVGIALTLGIEQGRRIALQKNREEDKGAIVMIETGIRWLKQARE